APVEASPLREDDRRRARRAERARVALPIFDALAETLGAIDRPAPWPVHAERLRWLAEALGLGTAGDDVVLDHLWDALDDRGAVLDSLGRRGADWSWAEFAAEVEDLVRELDAPPTPPAEGVRLATIAE